MANVLVVEDSPTMRQLISFALKRVPGTQVTEASDGVDALKKISGGRFDLLITDVNMPVMDGIKLISLVRKDPNHRDLPIIIITTEGAEEDRKRGLAAGANAYLTKPIQTSSLVKLAADLLEGIAPQAG
ncbi:MAG: two-component system response regulator [Nitrospirae bacterium RBG_16_64_22]|nr:MAG: two-component system response regulator [Nitrospirae bacterium RBG_16_64_22]